MHGFFVGCCVLENERFKKKKKEFMITFLSKEEAIKYNDFIDCERSGNGKPNCFSPPLANDLRSEH